MECPVRWFRDCLSGPHLLVPFLSCGFDAGRGHSYFCFFFLPSSRFFLISPRLDFSFYNVVIPELCFLFYNNRGHYTGLILVCIPFSVFERNFVFYSVQRRSPHNNLASISHFRHKSRGFVWYSERPLHPTGQCRFVRKILSHTLQVSPPLGGERFFL